MSAVVIITGGGGFLGQCLATCILNKGSVVSESDGEVPLAKIILADIAFPPSLQPTIEKAIADKTVQVSKVQGDVSQKDFCDSLYTDACATDNLQHVSVFHLGAVMSGDGERDFDLCMRVNLHGCLNMLEGARHHCHEKLQVTPKFLFASAGAIIGSGAATDYISKTDTISDATRATPHTTYGATKACCELLLSDYARRGFINGRALRLPTIAVRAGLPNAATTGCYSAVVREPLAGVPVVLPIAPHVKHAITSQRAAISGMMHLHDTPLSKIQDVLGYDRTIFLPAQAISLEDLHQGMLSVIDPTFAKDKLGSITYEVDATLSDIVGSFPTKINADRAQALGIPPAPSPAAIVVEYIQDFPDAVQGGLTILKPNVSTTHHPIVNVEVDPNQKVAVITGAGSGIGRGVAERLAKGGWAIVLAGRSMETLQQTKLLLGGDDANSSCHVCVPTDVSNAHDVKQLFEIVEAVYGKCDLLFNNAGINSAAASFEDVEPADFERVLKTNVTGPFLCAKAAMNLMKKSGGGRIINNGSISAHVPRPHSATYTTSKHAVLGLTKVIALDGRKHNVACGQIDFGNVVTQISKATNKVESGGALQPNGERMIEASMDMKDACETFWAMANLTLQANVLQMTVMATQMPFVGRG